MRDSFEIDDDDFEAVSGANADNSKPPPAYENLRAPTGNSSQRAASPLPAPIPTKPAPLPRESLDGETIFAVGEDGDKLDSDDEDDDERRGLTGGKKD